MKNDTLTRRACTYGIFGLVARTTLRAAAGVILLAPFTGTVALAAESPVPPEKAQTLDPVVVVASRAPEKLSEVSPSVTYIDAVDLAPKGLYSLPDALRDVPGVYAAQSGATGALVSLFTRGTNSNMTEVLLDGRRLNPGFGGGFDPTNLGTDNLASVQMLRGASSTLYGANAMGGAIDMRSINGLDLTRPVAWLSGEGGSYGYWRTAFQTAGNDAQIAELAASPSAFGAEPHFGFSLGGSWTQTDNKRPNSEFRNGQILPRFDYRVNENLALNLLTRYSESNLGLPGATVNSWVPNYPGYDANNWQTGRDWLVSPGITAKFCDDVEVTAFYSYANSLVLAYNSAGPDSRYEQDKHEATVITTWHALDTLDLSLGYTFEETRFRSRNVYTPYDATWDSNSPWMRAQWTPVEDLKISAGARYNAFNNFDDAWTGDCQISYCIREAEKTDTTLYAKVANAYRTPSANDIAGGTVGGVELKPEQSVAWEIGVKQNLDFLQGATLSVVYFENYLDDLIDFRSNPATWAYESFNVDNAVTRGWEVAGSLNFTKRIKLFGNIALLDARSKSDVESMNITDGDRLRRRPDLTMTGGVEFYPWDTVTVGFSATYVHGREDFDWNAGQTVNLKDYVYGRLYATWRFWEQAEIFGRVENLFDAKYDGAALNYPALPITAYAGMRFTF